ncbi:MAG: class A beta-lactamase-related serine hydrolase [Bacteroidia bacterium]|nr:class A beta-lactamase-related serine hydrolase [Bacteroidia bacterium]
MRTLRLVGFACILGFAGFSPVPQIYRPQVNTLAAPDTLWLKNFILTKAPHLLPYLQAAETYHLQIIYTQVNRDAYNRPILKHYAFRLDTNEYFYPASLVKLPLAALALERIERLRGQGVTVRTPFILEPLAKGCLQEVPRTAYSVVDCLRRQMVYSDNTTFDYLYALVGPGQATQALWRKGYHSAYFGHRLGRSCSPEENRCAEGIAFQHEGRVIYRLPPSCTSQPLPHPYANHPYLFLSDGNALNLKDAHTILISLIFPQAVRPAERFQLSSDAYHLLRRYLSMYPSEAREPDYDPREYHDGVRKYFLAGGDTTFIPPRIRIFNKVGLAYGYLSDVAYIVDFELGVEFFLSAVLYVGRRKPNYPPTGTYAWKEGLYFFRELGWALYRYETTRPRPRFPDLSALRYDYRRP